MNNKEYLKLLKQQDDMISKFGAWLLNKIIKRGDPKKNGSSHKKT